eukprot:scaffold128281_cov27-Phaeocystis_antarctica.AAC.1
MSVRLRLHPRPLRTRVSTCHPSCPHPRTRISACPSEACTTRVDPREQAFSRPASRCVGRWHSRERHTSIRMQTLAVQWCSGLIRFDCVSSLFGH